MLKKKEKNIFKVTIEVFSITTSSGQGQTYQIDLHRGDKIHFNTDTFSFSHNVDNPSVDIVSFDSQIFQCQSTFFLDKKSQKYKKKDLEFQIMKIDNSQKKKSKKIMAKKYDMSIWLNDSSAIIGQENKITINLEYQKQHFEINFGLTLMQATGADAVGDDDDDEVQQSMALPLSPRPNGLNMLQQFSTEENTSKQQSSPQGEQDDFGNSEPMPVVMDGNGKYVFQSSSSGPQNSLDDGKLKVPMSKFPKAVDKSRNEVDDLRYLNSKLTIDIKQKNKTIASFQNKLNDKKLEVKNLADQVTELKKKLELYESQGSTAQPTVSNANTVMNQIPSLSDEVTSNQIQTSFKDLKSMAFFNDPNRQQEVTQHQINYIKQIEDNSFKDRAFGCIIGSFIGDSVGSSYENGQWNIKTHQALLEMMYQGGKHQLGPGQISDGPELQMAMMTALIQSNKVMNIDIIFTHYKKWYQSNPFNIDPEIQSVWSHQQDRAIEAIKTAEQLNSDVKSNGCLARILPLAIWCTDILSIKNVKKAIVSDVQLSHSNKIVQEIALVYCAAIGFLVRNPNDEDRIQKAFDLAEELSESDIANSVDENDQKFNCKSLLKQALALSQKADYADNHIEFLSTQDMSGTSFEDDPQNIMNAFILCFYFLLRSMRVKNMNELYSQVLRATINLGGSTEVNTSIVGGMMGAIVGIKKIPEDLLTVLLSFDSDSGDHKVDSAYSVRHNGLSNIEQLIKYRSDVS